MYRQVSSAKGTIPHLPLRTAGVNGVGASQHESTLRKAVVGQYSRDGRGLAVSVSSFFDIS